MATRRKEEPTPPPRRKRPPATTPEARERQLAAKAMDLVEQQIEDGSASSQILSHFLRETSTRATLELAKLRSENDLLKAKVNALESAQNIESLMEKALEAFTSYRPPSSEIE